MKKIPISIFLFFALLVSSCEPNIAFERTVPPNSNSLIQIPDDFQGVFFWNFDNSFFLVSEDYILQELWFKDTIMMDDLNEMEDCKIEGGNIYSNKAKECLPFTLVDSARLEVQYLKIDTMFKFSPSHKAKFLDDVLYLNFKDLRGNWVVHMVKRELDGTLYWSMLELDESIPIEKVVKEFKSRLNLQDEVQHIVNPSAKEFQKILDNQQEGDVFKIFPVNLDELTQPLKYQ